MTEALLIKGNYNGAYTYGQEYDKEIQGSPVSFNLLINSINEDGSFIGQFQETSGIGFINETINVKGFIEGEELRFFYKEKAFSTIDAKGEVSIDGNVEPLMTRFIGVFDPVDNSFSGEWEMGTPHPEFGEDGDLDYDCDVNGGDWEMIFEN